MAELALPFPQLLKEWRHHRRLSQLDLANHSGISQRHISFLETGRSNPSRQMVVTLCDSLEVPLRERNALLAGAGFAPLYQAEDLDHDSLEFFKDALATVITHHEPYPAVVLDGAWNVVLANDTAVSFFSRFTDPTNMISSDGDTFRIVRVCLEEAGLKPYISNWPELMYALLQRCRRALTANPKNTALRQLIDEIVSHPEAPKTWLRPDPSPLAPVLDMNLEKDGQRYSLFTMLAHFGTPEHVTLAELSVESFYPADPQTKAFFHSTAS